MILIDGVFNLLELIILSPCINNLSTQHDSITIFCIEGDFALANAIYFQYPNVRLKPESAKSNEIANVSRFKLDIENPDLPKVKQGFYLGHKGIGDMINLQGAVNYLSEPLDELFVVCHSFYVDVAKDLYKENKKIRLIQVNLTTEVCRNGRTLPNESIQWTPTFHKLITYFETVYLCGLYIPTSVIWRNQWDKYPIPDCFYDDLGIDRKIKNTHNTIKSTARSNTLYEMIKDIPYIFVHQTSSNKQINLVKWDIQSILTIDPDTNLYKQGDPFYELANKFVKHNIFDYYDLMKNASELYTVDSSYSCLGLYCKPLKAKKSGCYVRATLEECKGWFD
jgi:hypothetical protein